MIFSADRMLLEVWIINGKIEAHVPDDIAKLTDWKTPLILAVPKGNLDTVERGM